MASATRLAGRVAMSVCVAIITSTTTPAWAQITTPQQDLLGFPPIPINQLSNQELIAHPALLYEEALAIIEHKKQHGQFLHTQELLHCGMSLERIAALTPLISISPPTQWVKQNWKRQFLESQQSFSITAGLKLGEPADTLGYRLPNIPIPVPALAPQMAQQNILPTAQMQWRYHNPNNFSMGFSMQIDAGERIRHPKDFIQKFHLRTGDFKRFDQIVVGRYSIQLGQGLVQGGLSGYWNAPIVWARKTPDWQLAEKRGWDEYRGHSGLGISGKSPKNGLKWMVCASRENISARITENGKISSLITDGNFSTASQLSQQYNTLQSHATVAVLTPKGLGFGLSGYRYNREWAKEKLGAYPEVWFTHYHRNGDLQFGHLALQYNLPAMVWGYVRPINKTTDLSVRTYWIHRDFKPPQGLFNQFNNNQWRVAAMYSQGNAGKKLWRWGVEMGKDIKYNPSNGVRRFHHKQQFHWERALFSGVRWQGDWQMNFNNDQPWPDDFFKQWEHRFSGEIRWVLDGSGGGPAEGWSSSGQITLIPHTSQIQYYPDPYSAQSPIYLQPYTYLNTSPYTPQIQQPNEPQAAEPQAAESFLISITTTYRKPFTPLKFSAQILHFNATQPLYFSPIAMPSEINNYVLSGKGTAINFLTQTTIKHNHHQQTHIALRTEIIVKNTTEKPFQPRIFVSLWWK